MIGGANSSQRTAVQASKDGESRKLEEVPAACAPCQRRWGDGADAEEWSFQQAASSSCAQRKVTV